MVVKFSNKMIDKEKLGNKAAFLMEMTQQGFSVPSGFVLDSDTYDEVIKLNNLEDKIKSNLNKLNDKNVSTISKNIIDLFNNIKLPESVINQINELTKDKKLYAVRSSGTKEDLENFSFAGQYETFLNTRKEDLITNVINCYKSMFSETLLTYIYNNKIDSSNLKMAVIIQEMVTPDYSGICFTINPITGKDKEMLIEVAPGLGENIVSGKVSPEQINYDWFNQEILTTRSKYLTKKNIKEYGIIFTKIQEYFGYPCDIEFAIKKNKLYILQARRITKINYSSFEDLWSTADFKDGGVSASVCTPYMWSLYEYIWEFTLRKFILDSKILSKSEMNKKLGDMYYGRCYWNLSVVKNAMSQVVGYKEREFDSEYGIVGNYEGDGKVTKLTLSSILKIAKIALAQSKILKTRNKNAENYKKDLLKKYNDYKNNYDENNIKDIKEVWYNLTKKDYLQSESTYFWQIFINTIHQTLYKDSLLKYVDESEYLSLLSSIDNISHLLPFYDMWDISRLIRNNQEALSYWETTPSIKIVKNLKKKKHYLKEVKEVIDKYGYHSNKELDVSYPCYYEEQEVMIDMIKEMLPLSDEYSASNDKERGAKLYQELLEKIKNQVSHSKYKKINKKIIGMRKMLWWREEFRDISTRFYYIIRVYTILLANTLVSEKVINEIDDIWYLRVTNLWDYLDGKLSKKEIKNIIEKNRLYYNCFRNYMSENEIGNNIQNIKNESNKNVIKGIGANNGRITGTARVITSFDEINRLENNDILITKYTDTGWTPKFAILSGIVTEYGGILCHAAIVSREYGIPAIVCCTGVLNKIKEGDIITIDGTTGEVILSNEEE